MLVANNRHAETCPMLPFQGKYAQAEALFKRSQAMKEKILHPEHMDVATCLHLRADVLTSQVGAD